MRHSFIAVILFIFLIPARLYSQDLSNKSAMFDTTGLKFHLYSSAFFDNKEFTSDIKKGYTYPGFFIQPRVEYNPSSRTSISGGFHTLYFAGADSVEMFVPVLTFKYLMTDKINFILGTIESKDRHFLPEPLYKPERLTVYHPETGVQFLAKTDRFKGDLWINWERYIKNKSPFQEIFTLGISGIYSIKPFEKTSSFYFPFHALGEHHGGQILAVAKTVTSLANFGGGIGYNFYDEENTNFGIESLFLFFKDISPNPHYVYKSGNAIYPKIYIKGLSYKLDIGLWKSTGFVNPKGEELFGSLSTVDSTLNQKDRNLITVNYIYQKLVAKGFTVEFRFDVYYDYKPSIFDYSYTFRMVFDDSFLLNKNRTKN